MLYFADIFFQNGDKIVEWVLVGHIIIGIYILTPTHLSRILLMRIKNALLTSTGNETKQSNIGLRSSTW